ncbi:MAG: hypothetical protein U5N85_22350 [Arcicella sp.]|nr:hypothetical protein [Arcicella sp.]
MRQQHAKSANSQNYTCASSFTYAAPTNNNNCFAGTSGVNYGCLSSTPNQMWFVITVQTGGMYRPEIG